ncbi:PVC-type heme-binding CxxCH protein [Rubinisphaera margarita]|uniref:PVC-type heme-binding CxxCH protein n=1 Tax=Rubinisphaera margarita TaxID=2909586 RepID=UPI001EE89EA3|nr:PVC-type heme-binding CxxCH protein [Rubinisphaera margarita]MCG6156387.1 c-type cytochrome [Rubinisphaera margarita]
MIRVLLTTIVPFVSIVALISAAISEERQTQQADAKPILCEDDLDVERLLVNPEIAQPLEVKFDERGRMWVVEYRQYPDPAGVEVTDRDEYWRVEYDKQIPPPPHAADSPFRGTDRITVHTDTNANGQYDRHEIFLEGLNLATSVAFDRDGVWVLTPPYLVFYPTEKGQLQPSGSPIVHLQGFGLEDTHSIANSLEWGADGWLYGVNGSTCSLSITSPFWTTSSTPVERSGQCVWRYHPVTHAFEIFAEGGGNSFGLEIDAHGDIYSGHNGGNTRGFHFLPGAYYLKNFGKHGDLSNSRAFGFFPGMQHHNVERFTHHFLIYEAEALPERFRGQLVGIDILHNNLVLSAFTQQGSTFQTRDLSRPVWSEGTQFRPVDLTLGFDGNLYVADWADSQVNHYRNHEGFIEPETGAIYRLKAKGAVNVDPQSFEDLVAALRSPNRAVRQTALRLIRERQPLELSDELRELYGSESPYALDAYWALHALSALTIEEDFATLQRTSPWLRRWAVRFLCEQGSQPEAVVKTLAKQARIEQDARVVAEIACSVRRLPDEHAWPVVQQLLTRDEFADDPFLPLLVWWAFEQSRPEDPQQVQADLQAVGADRSTLYTKTVESRLVRCWAGEGTAAHWSAIATLLDTNSAERVLGILDALGEAFSGLASPKVSSDLKGSLVALGAEVPLPLRLRLRFEGASEETIDQLKTLSGRERSELLKVISEVKAEEMVDPLLSLIAADGVADSVQAEVISTLGAFADPRIGRVVLKRYGELSSRVKSAAVDLLVSRASWTELLLEAVDAGRIESKQVPVLAVNRMKLHGDPEILQRIHVLWPTVVDPQKLEENLHRWTRILSVGGRGDIDRGKLAYEKHCAACHQLNGQGRKLGPDLTSYQRSNRAMMLLAILAPSAEIREGFENAIVVLDDGSILNGIIGRQNDEILELTDTQGAKRVIPREKIELMKISPVSIMPDSLLEKIQDQEARDLFEFLQSQPAAIPQATEK